MLERKYEKDQKFGATTMLLHHDNVLARVPENHRVYD
jgi:hypothetical protein